MKRIILASGSPRRRELMAGLNLEFTVDTGNSFEEIAPEGLDAAEVPMYMAKGKSAGFHRMLDNDEILVAADTVVVAGGAVLGKPHDREQAVKMLELLSGRTHEVITAVAIRTNQREEYFSDSTLVTFTRLSPDEIAHYVERYRPYDKAGAYGIQEWIGYIGISRIEGSFYNVMGFPVHKVYRALQSFL